MTVTLQQALASPFVSSLCSTWMGFLTEGAIVHGTGGLEVKSFHDARWPRAELLAAIRSPFRRDHRSQFADR